MGKRNSSATALLLKEDQVPVLRWYVAETDQGQERQAELHLREKGFEPYLPMRRTGAQAKRIRAVPYFPSYLFVRLMVGADGWNGVFATVGLRAILGNDLPLPVSDALVTAIQAHELDGFVPVAKRRPIAPPFERGEKVRIVDGPFAGYNALFEEPIDARRVAILLSMLGRDSRATVDHAHLRSV